MRGDDAGLIDGLEHHRTGAVAKEDRGAAIAPVDDAAQRLGADHERALGIAETDELVGDRHRVDETAAGGLDRKGRDIAQSETILQQRAAVREDLVGRAGAEDDQIDLVGFDPCGLHRAPRRRDREIDGGFTLRRDPSLADAGAFADPFVRGLDHAFEIGVGQDFLGQVAASAGDPRVLEHQDIPSPENPPARSPSSACLTCSTRPRRTAVAAMAMARASAIRSALP